MKLSYEIIFTFSIIMPLKRISFKIQTRKIIQYCRLTICKQLVGLTNGISVLEKKIRKETSVTLKPISSLKFLFNLDF